MARCFAIALCTFVSWTALTFVAEAQDPFSDEAAADNQPADNPFDEAPAEKAQPQNKLPAEAARAEQPKTKPHDVHTDDSLREKLRQPTQMEFTETPLQDAIDFLKDYHGIEIQLDNRALENDGIGSDTPVTRTLKGATLASGLRLLLRDMDLTYVIRHGTLLVTTEKAAHQMTDLRVYAVDELVGPDVESAEVAKVLESILSASACEAAKTPPADSPKIVAFRNLLVVRATLPEHDEILQLLADFNAKLKKGE